MAELVGATALVDPRVLELGRRIVARAGLKVGVVASGYRPGARTASGTPSLHSKRPAEAIDIAARGATLGRLVAAALVELGHAPAASFAGSVAGWEIAGGGDFPGWGDHTDHLHLGLESVTAATSFLPGLPAPGRYDFASLMQLWVDAGGARSQAAMAAQIASLESGGRPRARLRTLREDSRGLWQINVKAHPTYANANLYDPRVNVRAAIAISGNGSNWSPWSTAARARTALAIKGKVTPPSVSRPGGDSGGGFFGGIGGAIGGIGGAVGGVVGSGADVVWGELKGVTEWATAFVKLIGFIVDPKNWLRLVEMLLGSTLLLLGLAVLVVEFAKQDSVAGAASRGIVKGFQRITPTGRMAAYYRRRGTPRGPRGYRPARQDRPEDKVTKTAYSSQSDEVPF